MIALGRALPPVEAGDLLAILSAGAYGAVMSSSYNTRLLVPEVLVQGEEFAVIRPRPSYEELLGQDRIPPWLA
jgi:diaminopimelate decarboxylase